MARGMMNLDLGLSDDDETPRPGRGSAPRREESVSDLLSGKDPTLKFAGGASRRSSGFNLDLSGGGGDPLDMLKDSFARRNSAPAMMQEPEIDEDEAAFALEMRRAMGDVGVLDDEDEMAFMHQGMGRRSATPPSARRSPSPGPGASGDDDDIDDIMNDVLDDRPARRTPPPAARRSIEPDQRSTPGSRRGSIRDDSIGRGRDDSLGRGQLRGDESPMPATRGGRPPRAGSRPPLDDYGMDDHGYSPRGDQDQFSQGFGGRRDSSVPPSYASEREGSIASERSMRSRGQEVTDPPHHAAATSTLSVDTELGAGAGGGGRLGARGGRKLAPRPKPAEEMDPLADIYGDDSGMGAGRRDPRRSNSPAMGSGTDQRGGSITPTGRGDDDSHLFAPMPQVATAPSFPDVELNVKPKRKLGMGKAKASPTPSASRTPPLEPEDEAPSRLAPTPTSGRATPPAAGRRSTTPPPLPDEQDDTQSRYGRSATPPLPDGPPSPGPSLPHDDDDDADLDDLLQDNTKAPEAHFASPPSPAREVSNTAHAKEDSDDGLPDFLKGGREPRAKRGEAKMAAKATTPKEAPKLNPMAADLGLSAEDMLPSDNSGSLLDKPGGVPDEGSGSGSGLMGIALNVKPKAGRRIQPKAKAKASAEEDIAASRTASAPSSGPSQAMSATPPQRVSPTNSAVQGAAPNMASGPPSAAHSRSPQTSPTHSAAQNVGIPAAYHAPPSAPSSAAHGRSPQISPQGEAHGVGVPPVHSAPPSVAQGRSPQISPTGGGIPGAHSAAHGAPPSVPASAVGSAQPQSRVPSSVPVASEPGSYGVPPVSYHGSATHGAVNVGIPGAGFYVSAGGAVAQPVPGHPPPYLVGQEHEISPRQYAVSAPSSRGQAIPGVAAYQGVAVPIHQGMDSAPPSTHGDYLTVPGLPPAMLPRSLQPPDGLPPGSPLTQTAQSESGSLHARFRAEEAGAAGLAAPATGGTYGFPAAPATGGHQAFPVVAAPGSPLPSDARRSNAGGGGTPGSEPVLSFPGHDQMQGDIGGRAFGGFSAFPPLSAAPSADLLSKLAISDAKVRHLELQLEDCDQRWAQRLADAKEQSEAAHQRMELQCHRLEAEGDRNKQVHEDDIRRLNEKKQLILQNFEMEKETVRREERRKAQGDLEKLRAENVNELEELRRKHERALSIAQQQADMEADNLRRAHSGEQQLTKLVEQVQASVIDVERMSRRVEGDKTLEWSVRERQLEAREKTVREMEARLSTQSKEVEDQRRRVSELVRHMEDSQVDDREALRLERDRLQAEHARLITLQQSVRDNDRNNKEALKHAWAQLEDEKHSFQQERLRIESELQTHREETELMERQGRQETERLKALHSQVEAARQNASRRIRETEATIASERRALMSDLEVFEEKRRIFAAEVQKLEDDKQCLAEARGGFEQEVRSVGEMAVEVQRRSEELKGLHDQAGEARHELLALRSHLSEERSAHGTELERLKTMQTLVEQQKLQLLQTENQLRIRGIEDIDVCMTMQATFPPDAANDGAFGGFSGVGVVGQQSPAMVPAPAPSAPGPLGMAPVAAAVTSSRGPAGLGPRMPATPGTSGSGRGSSRGAAGEVGVGGASRMELQTLLRRTKEASGDVLYIQEQFRFLQQSQPGAYDKPPPSAGFAFSGAQGSRQRLGIAQGMAPGIGPGSHFAALAPSVSTSTEDEGMDVGPTLQALRPLSSDHELTSAGSGSQYQLQ